MHEGRVGHDTSIHARLLEGGIKIAKVVTVALAQEVDLLYLCDSEAALSKVSRWIGSGPRSTLAGDANADIGTSIIE